MILYTVPADDNMLQNLKVPHAAESAQADSPQIAPGQDNPMGGTEQKQKKT